MTAFREAVIDLDAVTRNIRTLRQAAGTPHLIAVVKADGYGHGALPVARAALAGGADWLGTADIDEALALRIAGISAPVLCWLHADSADFAAAISAGVDLGVSSLAQLDDIAAAAGGGSANVHLKLDTGLSRNGVAEADWAHLFRRAADLETSGVVHVRGIFSHLSNTSPSDDRAALAVFHRGLALANSEGLYPDLVHLAATAAALDLPDARFNTVRIGIGMYGLSPFGDRSSADLGLTPAMTLRGRIAAVRRVPAGTGVSYSYTYRTQDESTLALVPLGYADGVPRQASGAGPVLINGRRFPVAGRVAMDQFVVDVGDADVSVGDDVILFGDPAAGAPSATDWADAAGTINYEIVTRIGARVTRRYTE